MVRTRNNRKDKDATNITNDHNEQKMEQKSIKMKSEEDTITHDVITPSSSPSSQGRFTFQGKNYTTYEEMVQAKRQRNEEYLKSSGLLDASSKVKEEILIAQGKKKLETHQRGLKAERKRKAELQNVVTSRRKSNRLAGVQADGMYVEEERGRGRIIVVGGTNDTQIDADSHRVEILKEEKQFFQRRINDGSDLSLQEAIELSGSKWVTETSVSLAKNFVSQLNFCYSENHNSPRSTADLASSPDERAFVSQAEDLSVDNESCVAKVVPDRIYSIAFHPSPHKLITVAGDKKGYLGFWDVDNNTSEENSRNGVHLFKPYNHAISNLEWFKSGHKLFSSAYDGSMRVFDVQKEIFTEVFATYDSSTEYKDKLGYDLLDGWTQFSCIDHRNEDCIFFSTSVGDVVHLDLRQKGKITFNSNLSDKKINSIRYVNMQILLERSLYRSNKILMIENKSKTRLRN
jgi:WD40 repeat protein